MQYDTLSKILQYIPYDSKMISNLSLVSKDTYDTITTDEYYLLWNWYTNNAPIIDVPDVSWLKIVDLFNNRIIIDDEDPDVLRSNEIVRLPGRPRRPIPKILTVPKLSNTRLQYLTVRGRNNDTQYTIEISSRGHKYIYNASRTRILTIILDIQHGVIYFIDDEGIRRHHIGERELDLKFYLILCGGSLDIIKDVNVRLIDILEKYGEEIFTCNLGPHNGIIDMKDILRRYDIVTINQLIKYNRITIKNIIDMDNINAMIYGINRLGIGCLLNYCNTKDYMYDLDKLLENVKNQDDLIWLLDNVVDSKKLISFIHIDRYRDVLEEYGVNSIPISLPKDIELSSMTYQDRIIFPKYTYRIEYGNIKLPISYNNLYNILKRIRYPYEYIRSLNNDTIVYKEDISIVDGMSFRDVIPDLHKNTRIKHNNGEYNVVVDGMTYYTDNIMDIVYLMCCFYRVPMIIGEIGLLLTQILRDKHEYVNVLYDMNRSILLSKDNSYSILERFSSIDSLYPIVIEGETLGDAFYIIPNLKYLHINHAVVKELPSSISILNKLELIDIGKSGIVVFPQVLVELYNNGRRFSIDARDTNIELIPRLLKEEFVSTPRKYRYY